MRQVQSIRPGNLVLPHPHGTLYRQRYHQHHEAGLAIEFAEIPGWGSRVTVEWPDGSIDYPEESQLISKPEVKAPK